MLFELGIAKKIGVPVRIAHCHTSKTSHPFINNILIDEFKKNYTKAVSVSSTAGDWLYGKNNYTILNNARKNIGFVKIYEMSTEINII